MSRRTLAVARAVGVIGATAALIAGVTFAALTSNNVTLTNNSFATASADLQIWDPGSSSYGLTTPGFNFTNIVPGPGETGPFTFWLKNSGGVPLTITGVGSGGTSSNVDLTQVNVKITNLTAGGSPANYSMYDLLTGPPDLLPGGDLASGDQDQYEVKLTVPVSAVSGTSASMSGVTWTFTGTQP